MATTLDNSKRATIYSVADAVGLSTSTVSLVVNNDSRVKPETVLAVREAIERLDYRPAPVMNRKGPRRRLRKPVRHQQVALLFGGSLVQQKTPVYSRVFQGVEQRLREEGWNLVVRFVQDDVGVEAMPHRLDGVLLFNITDITNIHPRLLRKLRSAAVVRLMGQPRKGDFFDLVTYDDSLIGEKAARYLTGKGHRRLVCLYNRSQERTESFQRVARELGAELIVMVRPDLVVETGKTQIPSREALMEVVAQIARMKPRPIGVFVGMDLIACGLHHALLEAGLKPGVDIEIVGTNNDAVLLDHLQPRPVSVDIHAEEVGLHAVEQLFWRLDHRREPRRVIQLEPQIAMQ